MILIVTSKGDYTADYVILKLKELNLPFVRFNTEDFPSSCECSFQVSSGFSDRSKWYLTILETEVDIDNVSGIWYRRPSKPDLSEFDMSPEDRLWAQRECEAHLRGIWEVSEKRIVSLPSSIRRAEEKPLQLKLASELGMNVPETYITNDPTLLKEIVYNSNNWVTKPLWSGAYPTTNSDQAIWCDCDKGEIEQASIDELRCAPVILQQRINKVFDSRIIYFGTEGFAFAIHQQPGRDPVTDWRVVPAAMLRFEPCSIPQELHNKCTEMLSTLNLRFGAFDFAVCEDGEHVFLEVNPNGQWAWLEIATGVKLSSALIKLLSGKSL